MPKQPNDSPLLVPASETEDERIPLTDMLFKGKLMSVLICGSCKHVSQIIPCLIIDLRPSTIHRYPIHLRILIIYHCL